MKWGVLVLLAGLAGAALAPRALAEDAFTVADVPVDATAANANAARDAARLGGMRRAYDTLLQRLTLPADRSKLPKASDAQLQDLVSGFEVAKEKTSGVRYLASYTYHFRADAIRRMLRDANIAFAEGASKPVVVLAVWQGNRGPVLWDDPNPWREAWGTRQAGTGLVPLVLPYGEAADVQAIDAAEALAGDDAHLQAVSQLYRGADVLVARAAMKSGPGPHSLTVTSTRYTPGSSGATQTWTNSYAAAAGAGGGDADLLGKAVVGTAAQVEEAWRTANIIGAGPGGSLVAAVPLSDLGSWIGVRDRLAGIPAIARTELISLSRQGARVAIQFVGDPAQLRTALAQRDLDLQGSDPDWVLMLRASAKAAANPAAEP